MKTVYVRPQVEAVRFAPDKPIAMEQPGWGWEDDVFSTPEAKGFSDKTTEGGDGNEG